MAQWPFWQPFRRRRPATAFLGLGSNVGDRLATLRVALRDLHEHDKVVVEAVSTVYETAPVMEDRIEFDDVQEPYLNLVAGVTTSLRPRALLEVAHAVEAVHGRDREREPRWGPRTLDIDILLYEDLTLDEVDLTIPHPRLTDRAFVLVPLTEVLPPGARLPNGSTIMSHLARLAPVTRVDPYVRLVEGPGTGAEPLAHRPMGPIGGPPRLRPSQEGDER
ncbi:MAG: 2-amino-4-hydroxy-6-hydroxymethyldihydropteridine diphosphokinase [Actinomycetota bacterium]|nr:2-amino-4-hydroxy-6-hydroxymethyldihydropteridine diphosphokinase [Actinomycetota bacterium]